MANNLVITIGRQFGSDGRKIGERVAELLGLKYYDKELIVLAAKKSGINLELLDTIDEKATNSLLYTLAMGSSIYGGSTNVGYDIPINDKLFMTQSEIIKELAEEGPCVIVGRSADYVLRDHPCHLAVFVYADTKSRIARVAERNGIGQNAAKDLVNKTDKRRANYYNFYTGRKWGQHENYDICIDSDLLGTEGAAQMIAQAAKIFLEKKQQQ